MNPVKEATKTVNEVFKLVGEESIPMPTEGTTRQRLETLLDIYTDKLIAKNPQYKAIKNKRDIPEMIVMYLNKMIDKEKH